MVAKMVLKLVKINNMKTALAACSLLFLTVFAVNGVQAQGVSINVGVRTRPPLPVYQRPYAPGRQHIWVGDNWIWHRGNYVFQPGYWTIPQPNARYINGFWQQGRCGWQWVPGYWQTLPPPRPAYGYYGPGGRRQVPPPQRHYRGRRHW